MWQQPPKELSCVQEARGGAGGLPAGRRDGEQAGLPARLQEVGHHNRWSGPDKAARPQDKKT